MITIRGLCDRLHSLSTYNVLGYSGTTQLKKERIRVMSLRNMKGMCEEHVCGVGVLAGH